jgi:8-amino-7-oxononanoate synthase
VPGPLEQRLTRELEALERQGLTRALPKVERTGAVTYRLNGPEVVGLCSNDYLGLAADPRLSTANEDVPSGAGSSRLINGDWPELRATETALAQLVGCDDAVLFPSGFQANVGALPALLRAGDLVYSDRLAHASLIDGLRLAAATPQVLPHGTAPPQSTDDAAMRVWVTESIFSMDGDLASYADLQTFMRSGGVVYLDEAHSLGLYDRGRPWSAHHQLRPDVILGTLGKALGCAGAFVAASSTICTWIRTRARSFVFSTGVSPLLAHRIGTAVRLVQGEAGDIQRERLWANAARLGSALGALEPVPSPIFPVIVGDNATALRVAADLLRRGFHVQPIRPPTVPDGTARLRITVSAAHTHDQLDAFADALSLALAAHNLVPRVERGRTQPVPRTPATGTEPS